MLANKIYKKLESHLYVQSSLRTSFIITQYNDNDYHNYILSYINFNQNKRIIINQHLLDFLWLIFCNKVMEVNYFQGCGKPKLNSHL